MDVRFLRGLAEAYQNIASKDSKTFYYVTDKKKLYLGDVLLSNEITLDAFNELEGRVKALEDAGFQAQINAINETLKSIATSDTVNAIDERLKAIEEDYLKGADKTELEGKITAHETAVNTKFADYSTTEQMNAAIDADVKVVTDYIAANEAKWSEKTDISSLEQRMTAVEGVADAAQTAQEVSDAIDGKIAALDLANTYDAKGAAATAEQNAKNYADQALVDFENAWIKADENGTVDKLNEIAAWLNTEGAGAQKIIADVATNAANIATNVADIDKVELKLNGIAEGDGTVKAAIDAVDGKFADYTKTADLGDLATKDEADLNLGQYAKTADISEDIAKGVEANALALEINGRLPDVIGHLTTKDTIDSADLVNDKVITKAKLEDSVQASLALADSALQSHQDISHLATKEALETLSNDVYDGIEPRVKTLEGDMNSTVLRVIAQEKITGAGFGEKSLTTVISENAQTCQSNFNTISDQLTWGSF